MKRRIRLLILVLAIITGGCGLLQERNPKKDDSKDENNQETVAEEKTGKSKEPVEVAIDISKETIDLSDAVMDLGVVESERKEAYQKTKYEFGRWIAATIYSEHLQSYQPIFIRFNKIYEDYKYPKMLPEMIEESNKRYYIEYNPEMLKPKGDIGYNILEYEIYVPVDFPVDYRYEMVEPDMFFKVTPFNLEEDIPSSIKNTNYRGLTGLVNDLRQYNGTYDEIRGRVFKKYCFYPMVKGFRKYGFEISSFPPGAKIGEEELRYNLIKIK